MTCLQAKVLRRCRAPEVEPLEPPAKRQRRFSRVLTSDFADLLRQGMLRGVLSWLQGGPLDTKAVQVPL
jgi:hypothetical protein